MGTTMSRLSEVENVSTCQGALGTFSAPDARLRMCTLTSSDRYRHQMVMSTSWPALTDTLVGPKPFHPDQTAETVARAFVNRWVSVFGAPDTITTDRGGQFESRLFAELAKLMGTTRVRTTSYHPAANGMVERFHRQLKSALKAHNDPQHWSEQLPLTLLCVRTTVKEDLACSPAKLVFGTTLRLPASSLLQNELNSIPGIMSRDCDNTWVHASSPRQEPNKGLLTSPRTCFSAPMSSSEMTRSANLCNGRTKGHSRSSNGTKSFSPLDVGGKREQVSVDRLKVAHVEERVDDDAPTTVNSPKATGPPANTAGSSATNAAPAPCSDTTDPPVRQTRSGRHVHWPKRMLITVTFLEL